MLHILSSWSEFPGSPDHQVEVGVQVHAGTDPTVVVQKLLLSDLSK